MPVRIFLTTFSQVSAPGPTRETSSVSSARPAIFVRWLWQVMQVLIEERGFG